MKRLIIFLLGLIFVVGCEFSTSQPVQTVQISGKANEIDECYELRDRLDNSIIETNNPPGRTIIFGSGDIAVGGTLVNIDNNGFSEALGYYQYTLRFRGNDKEGDLSLVTDTSLDIPYGVGEFYTFSFVNMGGRGMLSGVFVNEEFDDIGKLDC